MELKQVDKIPERQKTGKWKQIVVKFDKDFKAGQKAEISGLEQGKKKQSYSSLNQAIRNADLGESVRVLIRTDEQGIKHVFLKKQNPVYAEE